MPFTLNMPKLSPTMESGMVVKWHKKEGDFVKADELLVDIATDKATIEHHALDEGWLRKIMLPEKGQAEINTPIAIFSEKKDDNIDVILKQQPARKEAALPTKTTPVQQVFSPEEPLFVETRIKASPLAKKMAKELGIDLSTIKGTGPGGRIVEEDLTTAAPKKPEVSSGAFEEIEMTPMRKMIAKRLEQSKSYIPHFYVQHKVDAYNLVVLREQLAALNIKFSVNDFVLKAAAMALREYPKANRGFDSATQSIVQYKTVDISVAVSVEDGLTTPIIRHADYKTIAQISQEARALAQKAKAGKLDPEEYKGGSFTVTNLGMFGVSNFQAIINPPQGAILAIGAILDVPIVKNSHIVPGKIMEMSLSSDHRVIDGVIAAEFLNVIKKYLENPAALITT